MKGCLCSARWLLLATMALSAAHVSASEVSFVSGLYKSENNKADGEKTLNKSTVEVGARYGEQYMDNIHWFGQGLLTLRSYSGKNAPSNSTGLTMRGGMRMYFNQFSETVLPFVSGSAGYKSEKDAIGSREIETSGLFYWGDLGIRLEVGQNYFLELETNLFESALWATTKTKPVDEDDDTQTDTEQTKLELYVDTTGAFDTTTIGAGMKF